MRYLIRREVGSSLQRVPASCPSPQSQGQLTGQASQASRLRHGGSSMPRTQYRLPSASPYLTFSYLTLNFGTIPNCYYALSFGFLAPWLSGSQIGTLTRSAIKLLHVAPRDELDRKCQTVDGVRGMLPKLPELPPIPLFEIAIDMPSNSLI